jgi:hypothetical protein
MPPVEFEPTIPASARPQTYALDRAATGIGPVHMFTSHFGKNRRGKAVLLPKCHIFSLRAKYLAYLLDTDGGYPYTHSLHIDSVLYDNSNHFSLRPFQVTAHTAAFAALPICRGKFQAQTVGALGMLVIN